MRLLKILCQKYWEVIVEKGIRYDNGKPRLGEMIKDFAEPLKEI